MLLGVVCCRVFEVVGGMVLLVYCVVIESVCSCFVVRVVIVRLLDEIFLFVVVIVLVLLRMFLFLVSF